MEVLPGIFYKTSYGCMCQSYCFFCAVLLFCFWLLKKHYKIGFFTILTCLFSVFGQNFKVNNLATFFAKNNGKCGQVFDLEVFTCFSVIFSKISFSLQKEEYFWKKKNKKPNKNKTKVAKLLIYGGQIYWPYSTHIYIYRVKNWSNFCLF